MSPSVFKALLQFDQTGTLGRGEAGQFLHIAGGHEQPLHLGERVDYGEGGPVVGPVDGAGEQALPLGDVPGDEPAAVGVPPFDE